MDMIADLDIWRAAAVLMNRHGPDDAAIVAAQQADEFLAKGDQEGYMIWKAITDAVLDLRRDKPSDGELMN